MNDQEFEVGMVVAVINNNNKVVARRVIVEITPKRREITLNEGGKSFGDKFDRSGYQSTPGGYSQTIALLETWTTKHANELSRSLILQKIKAIDWDSKSTEVLNSVWTMLSDSVTVGADLRPLIDVSNT